MGATSIAPDPPSGHLETGQVLGLGTSAGLPTANDYVDPLIKLAFKQRPLFGYLRLQGQHMEAPRHR
jgi:hypothetical protein